VIELFRLATLAEIWLLITAFAEAALAVIELLIVDTLPEISLRRVATLAVILPSVYC
jgi:hypothetical protein